MEKCGATDVKALQEKVLETKADVGLATMVMVIVL